ncbi:MAG: hypothetical protein SGILL_007741, partial [Bacillariaceae sp.]
LLAVDTMVLIEELWCFVQQQQTASGETKTYKKARALMTREACEDCVLAWRIAALEDQGVISKLNPATKRRGRKAQTSTSDVVKNSASSTLPPKTQGSGEAVSNALPEDPCMPLIPALSKRFVDPTSGMPVYQFAVGRLEDTIYQFRVTAGPSGIANGGNGGFLTFLGARRLKQQRKRQEPPLGGSHKLSKPLLEACDGFRRPWRIKLTGRGFEDFHGETVTALPYLDRIENDGNVAESQEHLPGGYTLDDFEECEGVVFSSTNPMCSSIDLGCYAPFLHTDRKFQSTFDIKNFVWSNMPSSYAFDMVQLFHGRACVCDISDDLTGTPHMVAQQNVPMHINETGGSSDLKQTVWAGDTFRGVNYYFHTKFAGPLKKRQQIELFICYSDTYVDVRERKGYGKRDTRIKSDDHFPSYVERQLVDRFNMVEEVFNEIHNAMDMHTLTDLLVKIRDEVASRLDSFIQDINDGNPDAKVPSGSDIVALRRLNWLKPVLIEKIEFMKEHKVEFNCFLEAALNQCKEHTEKLEWSSWPLLFQLLRENTDLLDQEGQNLLKKLQVEAIEEVSFELSTSLLFPFREDTWCGVARALMQDLCVAVAKEKWNDSINKKENESRLMVAFTTLASNAVHEILSTTNVDSLSLSRDCWKRYNLCSAETLKDQPRKTEYVMAYNDNLTVDTGNIVPTPLVSNGYAPKEPILRRLHVNWYICRQVLFVVDVFAEKYLGTLATECANVVRRESRISPDVVDLYLKEKLFPEKDSSSIHYFYGADFEKTYRFGNQCQIPTANTSERRKRSRSRKRTASVSRREGTPRGSKLVFTHVLVKGLEKLGWTMDTGNRPQDFYLCPPGVIRGGGFKPRVDFFDSIPLVKQCLESDTRYCNQPEIIALVKEAKQLEAELVKLKKSKEKLPKFASKEELLGYLKTKASKPSAA